MTAYDYPFFSEARPCASIALCLCSLCLLLHVISRSSGDSSWLFLGRTAKCLPVALGRSVFCLYLRENCCVTSASWRVLVLKSPALLGIQSGARQLAVSLGRRYVPAAASRLEIINRRYGQLACFTLWPAAFAHTPASQQMPGGFNTAYSVWSIRS